MGFIVEWITKLLLSFTKWRIKKAEKWALKHTKIITLKNGLKMLKAEKLFPLFYRLPVYNPERHGFRRADTLAMVNIAKKENINIESHFKNSSRIDMFAFGKEVFKELDMNRIKSKRIIEGAQLQFYVGFRLPLSEEELILAAEQSCDPNETFNPLDAEKQPADMNDKFPNINCLLDEISFRITLLKLDLMVLIFGKKSKNKKEDTDMEKVLENRTRLIEIQDGINLLVGDNFDILENDYLPQFIEGKNVRFVLARSVKSGFGIIESQKSPEGTADLRKLESSDFIVLPDPRRAYINMNMRSNTDVAEMLKKVLPEKTAEEGV